MTEEERGGEPIIKVHGLHRYFDALHIIKGVNLDVKAGEVVVIMGPSGEGKGVFCKSWMPTDRF